MIRNINRISLPILVLLLTACGGGGSDPQQIVAPPDEKSAGLFSLASDASTFEAALKTALLPQEQATSGPVVLEAAADSGSITGSSLRGFSSTYTLEDNVDESDLVKYTGEHLLVAKNQSYGYQCCANCFCALDTNRENPDPEIQIYSTDPASANVTPVAKLQIGEIIVPDKDVTELPTVNAQISGMYTIDSRALTVLGSTYPAPKYGDVWRGNSFWLNNASFIQIYDIEDPENSTLRWTASFNGNLVETRRIGNTLYVISRFTPYIEGLNYYYSSDPAVIDEQQQIIDNADLEDLVPKIRIQSSSDAVSQDLFNPEDCYIPTEDGADEGQASGTITTITAIPIDDPDQLQSTCYTGGAHGLYMSENALYLAETVYAMTEDDEEKSLIHKFSLNAMDVNYRGSGAVAGALGGRGAIDFRMSEYNQDLRVVSTIYDYSNFGTQSADNLDHQLTILRESSTEFSLQEIATLPNADNPQEIGKPNEQLYGVRFAGDRAYLVTFERIDPLYVLDLSDPENPLIAGELEVPGFSDFIHPVSEDLVLALGKDVTPTDQGFSWFGGMKLELYNVSDISNPLSLSKLSIGDRGSDSEALYDRHAFTYVEVSGNTHRFAIPVDVYEEDPGEPSEPGFRSRWQGSGLHLFELQMLDTPDASAIVQQGEMRTESATDEQTYPAYDFTRRSVFHDEAVFYINQEGVWSAIWSDPQTLQGPVTPES